MDGNDYEERSEELTRQLKEIAVEAAACRGLAAVGAIQAEIGEAPRIDPLSFVLGGLTTAASRDVPAEVLPGIVAAIAEEFAPVLARVATSEEDVADAFADLPVYDPGNGS